MHFRKYLLSHPFTHLVVINKWHSHQSKLCFVLSADQQMLVTKIVNLVKFITAKHQRVSIVIVSMLLVSAFSWKQLCALEPHRTGVCLNSCSTLCTLCTSMYYQIKHCHCARLQDLTTAASSFLMANCNQADHYCHHLAAIVARQNICQLVCSLDLNFIKNE